MDNITLIDKYLIVNNEYEVNAINQILEMIERDISFIYMNERSGLNLTINKASELAEEVSGNLVDYVNGFDDSNAGEILLLLSKLPLIANNICLNIEKNTDLMNGITQISARDKVDAYMKKVFNSGYQALYHDLNDKQIGVNLYYQCEKFIDALVLEFKQNILPMIDNENLVFDDIFYFRRYLINLMNNNENYEFFECSNCSRDDCTYTLCSVLPKVKSHNETHDTLNKQINFLNKLIDGQNVSEQQINALGNSKYAQMIKNLMSVAGKESSEEHKKIKFIGKPKIFSIISAERFEKILKRRYTGEAYEKDNDIYYMLITGINPYEEFQGDELLVNIKKIYEAYNNEQSVK